MELLFFPIFYFATSLLVVSVYIMLYIFLDVLSDLSKFIYKENNKMKLKALDETNKPYTIFADSLDGGTIDQFTTAMQHEAVLMGALMPDAHSGYSLPIGGVVLCENMVFPSFVGYDIGCGVSTTKTSFRPEDIINNANAIFDAIYGAVPTGIGNKNITYQCVSLDSAEHNATDVVKNHFKSTGMFQLGTLGSGNHFIEIGSTEFGEVFVTVHSGSRNLGHTAASHYMKLASNSSTAKEGVYGLDANTQAFRDYMADMKFCLVYAEINREIILQHVIDCLCDIIPTVSNMGFPVKNRVYINKAHNFVETTPEGHFLHRKGATIATKDTLGVIPGNMRDGVYVVAGLGNPDGLDSCSHGAGRTMSRTKAKDKISLEDFADSMQGIKAKVTEGTKDESPFAYKDFDHVMELQKDLCKVLYHIKPLINIKG